MTDENNQRTVFLFSTHDISVVQGTTEAHYVAQFFGSQQPTYIFAPLSDSIDNVEKECIRSSTFRPLLLLNILLIPKIIYYAYKYKPTTVYVYRNVIIPPLIMSILTDATIVYDLRVDPYQQPKEFNPDTLWHRIFVEGSRLAHNFALKRADIVITLSPPLRQSLVDNFDLKESEIHIVPLGVDTEKFSPPDSERADFHIAYLGSIQDHRGLETVIKALNELQPSVQETVVLDLIGDVSVEYKKELEALVDGQYRIKWRGYIDHENIPEVVGKCDCAVSPLPPLKGFEVSSPAKIFEYLSLGLPVIATDITPHRRLLDDETDSLLIPPDDPTAMSEAIARLATQPSERKEMSDAARQNAFNHDWQKRFQTITEIINEESNRKISQEEHQTRE